MYCYILYIEYKKKVILVVSKVITHGIPRALVGLKSKYRGKDVIAKIPWTIQTGEIEVKSKIQKIALFSSFYIFSRPIILITQTTKNT